MTAQRLRVVVLVDGHHTDELVDLLSRLVALDQAEVVFVYVFGEAPRAGLEMVSHRPGGHHLPAERERVIEEAEQARGGDALAEAERLAGPRAAAVRSIRAHGKPGQAVCELAAREAADLVVVRAGGRDRPPIGPHSLGPAARFISDHSPCPVLLIR